MNSPASSLSSPAAVKASRLLFAIGMLAIPLIFYLVTQLLPWVLLSSTPLSTTITYLAVCVILLAAAAILFFGSYLLRHRLLLSCLSESPVLLVGPGHMAGIPLSGKVFAFSSDPEIVDANGRAYIARINRSWYFVAKEAADALTAHRAGA